MNESSFLSIDGNSLKVYAWQQEAIPRGIVYISHGLTLPPEKYNLFAEFLEKKGYLVIANLHRSFYGEKIKPDNFYLSVKDSAYLINSYRKRFPNKKVVLIGVDYGAEIVVGLIERYNFFNGAIITTSPYISRLSALKYSCKARFNALIKGDCSKNDGFLTKFLGQKSSYFKLDYNFYYSLYKSIFNLSSCKNMLKIDVNLDLLICNEMHTLGAEKTYLAFKELGLKNMLYANYKSISADFFKGEIFTDAVAFVDRICEQQA